MTEIDDAAQEVQRAQAALDAAQKKHDDAITRAAQVHDRPIDGDRTIDDDTTAIDT
jgi:hypothetical protein